MSYNERTVQQGRNVYWWVTGTTPLGKTLLLGAFGSEGEANSVGYQKFSDEFQVHALKTRDAGQATRMLKFNKMNEGADPDSAMERFHHGQETTMW